MTLNEFHLTTARYRVKGWSKPENEKYLLSGLTYKILSLYQSKDAVLTPEAFDGLAGDILRLMSDYCSLKGIPIGSIMPSDLIWGVVEQHTPEKALIQAVCRLNRSAQDDMIGYTTDDFVITMLLQSIIAGLLTICGNDGDLIETTLNRIMNVEIQKLEKWYPLGCFTLADHLRGGRQYA